MSQTNAQQPWQRLVQIDRHERPTRPLSTSALAAADGVASPEGSERARGARPAILVVDEFPFNHELLRNAMRNEFEVRSAFSGAEALQLAVDPQVALILLESELPDMSGVEVLRALRKEAGGSEPPAILLGAKWVEEEANALEHGACDFIAKPFHLPVVLARVRTQLRMAEQARLLERLGTVDALTGVANRRGLDDALDAEWRRAQRSGRPLTFCLADIDHFKRFNDRYGHPAGDRCLEQVARALAHTLHRPGDLVGRYGGEEFGLLLPGVDENGAARVGAAVRDAVLRLNIAHASSTTAKTVTISLGVGIAVGAEWNTLAELVALADSALYRAKRSGRNRVVQAVLEPPPRARLMASRGYQSRHRFAQAR